ncbi:aldo/keto reductase [Cyanobium sp. Alchichica 3B3-8F6]|uniref:aldo/keto reductase n=1 Tax=Cyanobium sp. Alchichica 3B3-8F6 TaxID=2823696 RepID=UPI0020CCD7A9|nr:aldo/keto reductase [Cyanobium sp. Alchichica 3B3-8F6]MCP9882396.1 aldo/keto reductase [Cyanobium sp. Alchichica 3B3-8F6]
MKTLELGMYGLSRLSEDTAGYDVISKASACEVLKTAWNSGIRLVDTAPGYGNGVADELIKDIRTEGLAFKVCSKIGLDIQRNEFKSSLQDIYSDVDKIAEIHDGYISRVLIHSPPSELIRDQSSCIKIISYIRRVLGEDVTVGIALRSPNDLADCKWGKKERDFVYQGNFSWLDTRIRKIALDADLRIIARSIYGSGILALLYDAIHCREPRINFNHADIRYSWHIQGILEKASSEVTEFRQECIKNKRASLDELVASLILGENIISGAILGPTTVAELRSTLQAFVSC